MTRLSRRRFIVISAAAAGLPLLPPILHRAGAASGEVRTWRGVALGADAVLQIHHPDGPTAERLVRESLAEVNRLERIFSLYDRESALARLNRDGHFEAPPADLVKLLADAARFGTLTDGAFDMTIQPLWSLYAAHFTQDKADPAGPPRAAIDDALALVDYRAVRVDPDRIAFASPGMAVTLNGIAQGYITDRVVDLLRRNGIASAIVDMGEIRAIGSRPDALPWVVGIEDPTDPARIAARMPLVDRAIATSGGYGLRFDTAGRFHHLLDPASGTSGGRYLAASIVARDATTADALSTGCFFIPPERTAAILAELGAAGRFVLPDGTVAEIG